MFCCSWDAFWFRLWFEARIRDVENLNIQSYRSKGSVNRSASPWRIRNRLRGDFRCRKTIETKAWERAEGARWGEEREGTFSCNKMYTHVVRFTFSFSGNVVRCTKNGWRLCWHTRDFHPLVACGHNSHAICIFHAAAFRKRDILFSGQFLVFRVIPGNHGF